MRKFLKSIYQFFLTIYIFESYPKFKKVSKKGILTFFIKSLNEVKINKTIQKYFVKIELKLNRLKKKSNIIGLKNKNEIICSAETVRSFFFMKRNPPESIITGPSYPKYL